MSRYCGRVEEVHGCGHTTVMAYSNCGNHEDNEPANEDCHNSTPVGRNNYVSLRRGSDKCFFPCKVSSMGWLCCQCDYKKMSGYVSKGSNMPEHMITHKCGRSDVHTFCYKCKIIDEELSSSVSMPIYSGSGTDIGSRSDSVSRVRVDSFMYGSNDVDSISNLEAMMPKALNVSSNAKENVAERRETLSRKVTNTSREMYDSLISGKELVLDLHSPSDKRAFRDMLSMMDVKESVVPDKRMNTKAQRVRR